MVRDGQRFVGLSFSLSSFLHSTQLLCAILFFPTPFYWALKKARFLAYSAVKNVTVEAGRRRICLVVVLPVPIPRVKRSSHSKPQARHSLTPTNSPDKQVTGHDHGRLGTLSGGEKDGEVFQPCENFCRKNLYSCATDQTLR